MKLKSIRLTGFFYSGAIQGSLGDIVPVTAENEAACKQLLKDKGAQVHEREAPPAESLSRAVDNAGSDDDENEGSDENALSDVSDEDSVDTLEIAPRYHQALKDAGLKTIADVKAHADLASVAGLNKTVAAKILKALE